MAEGLRHSQCAPPKPLAWGWRQQGRLCMFPALKTLARTTDDLIGTCRTFGEAGPVCEVPRKVDETTVRIVVVETGEELNYPAAEALNDPETE